MASIKSVCSERHKDWKNKFLVHGLKCVEIMDEIDLSESMHMITNFQLIITTPEKWDSLTKKCKDIKSTLYMVKLFLIDEVYMISIIIYYLIK